MWCLFTTPSDHPYEMFPVSWCKFWIYWVGVNTKFTTWQLYKTHVLTAITQCNRAHAKYKQEDNGSHHSPETRPQSINIFAQSHHDNDAITLEKNPIISFLKTEWSLKKLVYVIQRCFVQCFVEICPLFLEEIFKSS